MHDDTVISTGGLDIDRIGLLLWQELRRYQAWLRETPVPERQQARGLFIAWAAAFLPEAVPQQFVKTLGAFVSEVHKAHNYQSELWWRILPLDVAYSTLTGTQGYLRVALLNSSHQASQLRLLALEALSVVAEHLDTDDEDLRRCVARNLEMHQFYADQGVALVAVARGTIEAKRALLNEWRFRYRDTVADDLLRDLTEDREHLNPFIGHMLWLHQYACLRLMQTPDPVSSAVAKDMPLLQQRLPMEGQKDLVQVLWRRLRAHPLMKPHISLRGD